MGVWRERRREYGGLRSEERGEEEQRGSQGGSNEWVRREVVGGKKGGKKNFSIETDRRKGGRQKE